MQLSTAVHEKIPCLDLKRQHAAIKAELLSAFGEVIDNTAFSGGPFVERFEKTFAEFCGTQHAVGVSNGTTALHLAMLVLGIGAGDEVIVPANTFIATAWGPSYVGATPVFVDCLPDTWELDPAAAERAITPRTKAIIGVHLYGQPCDVDALRAVALRHKVYFIEDAAQAQGAQYKGTPVGGFGEMACFSFYPGKNLGATGEAGGITTNNPAYVKHLHSLRNHGCHVRYQHDEVGYNYRMGGLEGASLSVKMKYLADWNARRQAIGARYIAEMTNPKVTLQTQPEWAQSIYHLFVVTVADRDHFMQYLTANNIVPALHYPIACHLQQAYAHLNYKPGSCPNAEHLAAHCVSLPMFPELTDAEVEHVIQVVNAY